MFNVVVRDRIVLAFLIIFGFIVIPGILVHYGFTHEYIVMLTSMWAIFCLVLIAEVLLLWGYIRNLTYTIFALIFAVIMAIILTGYYGG